MICRNPRGRFDDVYRALLVIGPILSFSFSNYSLSPSVTNFIYYAGFTALITSVLLWAIAHLLNKSWEYHVKFTGYDCIWFACLVLMSIVYTKGDPAHSVWYWSGIAVTVIIAYLTGNIFVKDKCYRSKIWTAHDGLAHIAGSDSLDIDALIVEILTLRVTSDEKCHQKRHDIDVS